MPTPILILAAFAAMAAATVIGTAGLSSLFGRICCGLVADRIGAKPTLIAGLLIQATAISLYVFVGNLAGFYLVAMLFGLAYGGVMPLYAILVREYFGARIMGTVFGAVAMASTLGMALGPVAVFSGSAVLIVLLCLDVGFLGPRSTGLALEQVQQR